MRGIRLVLILAAAAGIAFALYSADKSGVSPASVQFMKVQGVAFVSGFLAMAGIMMKGKEKK